MTELVHSISMYSNHERLRKAVHRFLDEVERPVGRLQFSVPQRSAVDRAILDLFDAVEREP